MSSDYHLSEEFDCRFAKLSLYCAVYSHTIASHWRFVHNVNHLMCNTRFTWLPLHLHGNKKTESFKLDILLSFCDYFQKLWLFCFSRLLVIGTRVWSVTSVYSLVNCITLTEAFTLPVLLMCLTFLIIDMMNVHGVFDWLSSTHGPDFSGD